MYSQLVQIHSHYHYHTPPPHHHHHCCLNHVLSLLSLACQQEQSVDVSFLVLLLTPKALTGEKGNRAGLATDSSPGGVPGGARPGPGDVGAGAGLDGVEDGLADPGPANGVDDGPASTLSLNLAGAIPLSW